MDLCKKKKKKEEIITYKNCILPLEGALYSPFHGVSILNKTVISS